MSIFFAIIGLLFFAFSCFLFARRIGIYLLGAAATGRVVRIETRESDDSVSYLPVIEFVDVAGFKRVFTSTSGGGLTAFAVGADVSIRYSVADPSNAHVAGFRHMWGAPIAFLFMGVMAFWAALASR